MPTTKLRKRRTFDERFVAFVDVLGFRAIVDQMDEQPELFKIVRDTLKIVDAQAVQLRDHEAKYRRARRRAKEKGFASLVVETAGLQMTAFSDCYVVSQTFPAWEVLAAVQALGSTLLMRGMLCRGAVVQGQAYHTHRVLFGPAVNEAYDLEQNVAKYPRIIVTEAVRAAGWNYHSGLAKERLFRRDTDGCWFINLLAPPVSSWEPISTAIHAEQSARKYLTGVRAWLATRFETAQKTPDLRKLSKLAWLVHHFNVEAARESIPLIDVPMTHN